MLRITQNQSAARAQSYYSTADYYSEGQELTGVWRGEGATRLGLSGTVKKEDWDALCENRNPLTGEKLTIRQKDLRRIGWDFNFHVPKSVSLLYGLTQDDRLLEAFRQSVDETMRDMEAETKTRVRKDGKNEDRATSNMIWGQFVHLTSRPVDGIPDPHLHAHCFVFNSTWDDQEHRWKAAQIGDIKRDAPYFEAVFHSHLAGKLAELGVATERTCTGWEIDGLAKSTLTKFSRRTALIEEKAREQGISDPEKKGELGAKTRERKQKNLTMEELRSEWRSRLEANESDAIAKIARSIGTPALARDSQAAKQAVTLAAEHCFERKSVVPERELLREALKRSLGTASRDEVEAAYGQQSFLHTQRNGQRVVTTPEVLAEERKVIDFARTGRGTRSQLAGSSHTFKREWLNGGQRNAVLHVLSSRDRVVVIRGVAGVGKTSTMQEAVEAIQAHGTKVFTFAPSANASRGVLRSKGFADADTVAKLLADIRHQPAIQGQVIWIDEAGLLGTRAMRQVFELADKLDARVVLSGDRHQHGAVERGAALRLLETEAGLIPAEIKEIKRQDGAYKQAVAALSEGRVESAFRQLDKLGWIREVKSEERNRILAAEYVATVIEGKTALVVCPTHREGARISENIRNELKRAGKIGADERRFPVLVNANLTQAERKDASNFVPGDVLVFHQNAKGGYRKGQRVAAGNEKLPLEVADKFQVYHAGTLSIAPGDVIRITQNGKTADGRHGLDNGAIFKVKDFDPAGGIVLENGWTVAKDYGHLAHGYVVTSHASQGRDVQRIFIGQSEASFGASSREQFYVSVSRGAEQAVIFTDDKRALLEAVSRPDDRLTATECFSIKQKRERVSVMERLRQLAAIVHADPSREGHSSREFAHER